MKGFDPEFTDLDHYIRVITDRIWEGRRLDDIRRYYSEDCAVETPSSVSVGIEPVIQGTRNTLTAFPDRRLLAEDVIVSGDEDGGFLSSHRIFSPMAHAGPGVFGPATGRPVHVRTVADCVCIGNRIVHEWLVRDQAAIARCIGSDERSLAVKWLAAAGGWTKAAMPPAPTPYVSAIARAGLAAAYAADCRAGLSGARTGLHREVIAYVPGGEVRVGAAALASFWAGLGAAFPGAQLEVEHLVANDRPGRATAIAMRWRLQGRHRGAGRYGEPTGAEVEILGICHAEVQEGQVLREWVLIDDVAVWMQLLSHA
jgi:predicted ester cyclase